MSHIEDPELLQLFRAESEERLQKLDEGLLRLEKTPGDASLLDDLFREAHSLKGASRMLGLSQLQDLAHDVEDHLGDIRKGTSQVSEALVRGMLDNVDRMRVLANAATGGVPAVAPSAPPAAPPAAPQPVTTAPAQVVTAQAVQQDAALKIETLRVDASKLDFLLSQTGELVVSRSHMQRLQNEFERLVNQVVTGHARTDALVDELTGLATRFADDNTRLDLVTSEIESGIKNLRLLPISTLLEIFPRMVHDLANDQKKKITLALIGGDIVVDKRIIEEMKAPLMHLLRNSVDHGIEMPDVRLHSGKPETGVIQIRVAQEKDRVNIQVSDDGRGLDYEGIREQAVKRGLIASEEALTLDQDALISFLMKPGFSTSKIVTELSGRGVGLDVVRATVDRMHGSVVLQSPPHQGLTVGLSLPVSLISTRVLLIKEWGSTLAIPFEYVAMIRRLKSTDLRTVEGRECIEHNGDVIFINSLGVVLDSPVVLQDRPPESICVIVSTGVQQVGLLVDDLAGEQEVVLKSLPVPIQKTKNISGVTILDSGDVCPVLNIHDIAQVMLNPSHAQLGTTLKSKDAAARTKSVLLAEDSITTRVQEKRILEAAGYEVVAAVDGMDAWGHLSRRDFDAVVSDIMMPNMDGLELTRKIRENKKYTSLPIILVTSLATEEDKMRGMQAGADAYITKPEFDQSLLLDCLKRFT